MPPVAIQQDLFIVNDQHVVFKGYRFTYTLAIMCTALGLIFTFLGIVILSDANSKGSFQGLLVLFFGLLPFIVLYWLIREHNKGIKNMFFHLDRDYIELVFRYKNQQAYLAYENVESIHYDTNTYSDKDGKQYEKSILKLVKKDGEEWILGSCDTREDLEKAFQKIDIVHKTKFEQSSIPAPQLSSKLRHEEGKDLDTLEWKILDWYSIATSLLTISFLLLFLFAINDISKEIAPIFYFVCFILFIFVIHLFYSINLLVTKWDLVFGVSIHPTQVVRYEKTKAGRVVKQNVIAISTIKAITNSWESNLLSRNQSINVQQYFHKDEHVGIRDKIKAAAKSINQLYFSQLTFAESLELERWIQDRIKKRANVDVY